MAQQPAVQQTQQGPTAEDRLMIAVVKTDAPEDMQTRIKQECLTVFKECNTQQEMAQVLKKKMDELYGKQWNVIVGHNFASNLKHIAGNFIYLYIDQLGFLLFKTQ